MTMPLDFTHKLQKGILLIVIFVVSCGAVEAQTWNEISMKFPQGDTLLGNSTISFASKNIGWIVTNGGGTPNSPLATKILKTTDGGHNWVLQAAFDSYLWLSSIVAYDTLHCWVIGGPNGTGVMLSTCDGGNVWRRVDIIDTGGDYFRCAFFWDSQRGVAFNRHRWFTYDGGRSWSKGGDTLQSLPIPSDVFFTSGRFGWMVSGSSPFRTDAGFIALSGDSGKTWMFQDSNSAILFAEDFLDSLRGFAVGTDWNSGSGYIYATTNGGSSWRSSRSNGSGPYSDIGFFNETIGWIANVHTILRTTDGGDSWETLLQGLHSEVRKLIILKDDKVAYAFGDNHFLPPYTLLRADLSNLTSVKYDREYAAKQIKLTQNYPNPFNPSTKIGYELPHNMTASLKVYNSLGQALSTLFNGDQEAGYHEVTFDGTSFASGVYFYRLTVGSVIRTKKLLILR